jgi:hypothetical protein
VQLVDVKTIRLIILALSGICFAWSRSWSWVIVNGLLFRILFRLHCLILLIHNQCLDLLGKIREVVKIDLWNSYVILRQGVVWCCLFVIFWHNCLRHTASLVFLNRLIVLTLDDLLVCVVQIISILLVWTFTLRLIVLMRYLWSYRELCSFILFRVLFGPCLRIFLGALSVHELSLFFLIKLRHMKLLGFFSELIKNQLLDISCLLFNSLDHYWILKQRLMILRLYILGFIQNYWSWNVFVISKASILSICVSSCLLILICLIYLDLLLYFLNKKLHQNILKISRWLIFQRLTG